MQAKSGAGGLHTKALYIPSDPKTTELGWGVVHLYRDAEESSTVGSELGGRKSLDKPRHDGNERFDVEECSTLCIVAVPSWMMPSDLLGFVGDQAREDVSHFRLIRTGRTNKYMVLMKFRSPKKAREWQKAYNGRLFSSAEPENCHVVFIKSVEFMSPEADDSGEDGNNFPHNNQHDPFTPAQPASARTETKLSSKPLAPPPPNLLELPTCPVCLERMDETTGLLTILCQHVFHCACLEKWRFPGSGCPVCRYTQSPSYTFPYPRPSSYNGADDNEAEPMCSVCAENVDVNLWICLICGNIGCGRYDSMHAYAHYEATSHCYAMDINTQHVWDYAGDGYVHRLIQSKPDFASQAKAVGGSGAIDIESARPRHENEAYRAEAEDMVPREKMESMANEYTYLLTSQLEGQRRYFEEQVERAVDKAAEASSKAEAAALQATKATSELETGRIELSTLQATITRLEKSLEKSEKARAKFEELSRNMSSQLREEKTMNSGLMDRIKAADEKAETARKEAEKAKGEKKDLEDMNHDLTMFISSQEKVKELQAQGEEVVEGGIGVVEKPKKGKGRKR
jgi:BRCA1-associated protein